MTNHDNSNPWADDLLGYEALGNTFTKLIKTVDDSKVISIEAGFGHGKTFFREAWAKHLCHEGEVVIEIDAQSSDHSGDPVVTFLGALLAELPEEEKGTLQKAGEKVWKFGGVAARGLTHAVAKSGADELIGFVTGGAVDAVAGNDFLQKSINSAGDSMSKTATQLIASQLAAEKAIQQELPEQLDALRAELTKDKDTDRVIILIDELDRCHPEYAISLLETMKHIFDRPGFVFCLLVNADYLEKVAQHRFGSYGNGERYLDKFVDLRFPLQSNDAVRGGATKQLALRLPLGTPYGADPAFSVETAAELASTIVEFSTLSLRQIKRVLDRVEVALRCHAEIPLDCALLVYLAFSEAGATVSEDWLPRAALSPDVAAKLVKKSVGVGLKRGRQTRTRDQFVEEDCRVLIGLEDSIYAMPAPSDRSLRYPEWAKVLQGLGPRYIPDHKAVLNAAHDLLAPEAKTTE